jgi:integrase/recombinase XerD
MTKMEVEELDYHCYAILIYAEGEETVEEKDQRILNDDLDENDYSFFVFLIPEAARALDKYHKERKEKFGEVFTPDTPIFGAMDKHRFAKNEEFYQMSGNAFRKMIQAVLNNTSIKRIKKRNRFDIMIDHGFRKRFNTILKIEKDVNSNIAEKLMQHKKGLDGTYLTPTREECFTEFAKAISQLTIDSKERLRVENLQKDAEISELQKVKLENKMVNNKVTEMQKQLQDLAEKQKEESKRKPTVKDLEEALRILKEHGIKPQMVQN